jgi:hypothetical protein
MLIGFPRVHADDNDQEAKVEIGFQIALGTRLDRLAEEPSPKPACTNPASLRRLAV